jgi:uncharacterized protein
LRKLSPFFKKIKASESFAPLREKLCENEKMDHQHHISVLLKYPSLGTVKTRLAREIGDVAALGAYQEMVKATLSNLPVQETVCHVFAAPPEKLAAMATWFAENSPDFRCAALLPQPLGDLGARLWSAAEHAWAAGAATVTLVGTDCPAIAPCHYKQAWSALADGADVVFGPAEDGGYYLQAMARPFPELFQNIPWSQPHTLAAVLDKCAALGLKVARLEPLEDLDDLPSWQRWLSARQS